MKPFDDELGREGAVMAVFSRRSAAAVMGQRAGECPLPEPYLSRRCFG